MFIYEVNMSIEKEIYEEFLKWIVGRIQTTMLKLDGFIQADLCEDRDNPAVTTRSMSVRYTVDSQENFDRYREHVAPPIREESIRLFKDKFTSSIRFIQKQTVMKKPEEEKPSLRMC
jgi:hypothetical protein